MSKKTRKNNNSVNKSRTYKIGGAALDAALEAADAAPEPATAQSSNRPKLSHMNATRNIRLVQPPVKEAPDLFVSFLCDKDTKDDGQSKMTKIQDEIKEILSDLDIKKAMFVKENDPKTVGFIFNISYIKRFATGKDEINGEDKINKIFEICQNMNENGVEEAKRD